MRIASTITVTTAEVVVLIRNESGMIIMEKTLSMSIPERISEQMANIKVETLRLDKHEYRLDSIVKKVMEPDGTILVYDHIDQKF
jgi:hypothetical protein